MGQAGRGGSSAIWKMSQISLRWIHLMRWTVILLVVLGFTYFWYWHRKNVHDETNRRLGIGVEQVPCLSTVGSDFVLGKEGKKLRILSGSLHYFRVMPDYWEDSLIKMKACGLNTVTTYVPWNLHEQIRGEFDFTDQLDVVAFLKLAQKVGLSVILRPGPYICAEWDFGGLPSWLLSDDEMKVRSTYPLYIDAVDKYFEKLLPLVEQQQCHRGGPIIAFQVENEYGSYSSDLQYLNHLKKTMEKHHLVEMFLTSENSGMAMKNGRLPDVLMTANFQVAPERHFQELKQLQGANKPLMVMEFWSGWFDHWGEKHHIFSAQGIADQVKGILEFDASINFYVFRGASNFGFMNGANILDETERKYAADITSYDYDAPLTEAGDTTEKYHKIKQVLKENTPPGTIPDNLPSIPTQIGKMAYGEVKITDYLTLDDSIEILGKPISLENPVAMEKLPINQGGGQGYGFLLYQTTIDHRPKTMRLSHPPHDRAQVFLNSDPVAVMLRVSKTEQTDLKFPDGKEKDGGNILEILVENMGRVNYGTALDHERKGLLGDVDIDGKPHKNWNMLPFEFKRPFLEAVSSSTKWKAFTAAMGKRPALYRATLDIPDRKPKDTYLSMKGWGKGVMFVNGFNLGRYWDIGPSTTYYLPGPLLKSGANEIVIFELHQGGSTLTFTDTPDLGETVHVQNDEDV